MSGANPRPQEDCWATIDSRAENDLIRLGRVSVHQTDTGGTPAFELNPIDLRLASNRQIGAFANWGCQIDHADNSGLLREEAPGDQKLGKVAELVKHELR